MIETIKIVVGIMMAVFGICWMVGFAKATKDRNTVDMIQCGFWAVIMLILAGIWQW